MHEQSKVGRTWAKWGQVALIGCGRSWTILCCITSTVTDEPVEFEKYQS